MSPGEGAALQEQWKAMGAVAGDTKVDVNRFGSLIGFRREEFTRFVFNLYDIDKNGFITEVGKAFLSPCFPLYVDNLTNQLQHFRFCMRYCFLHEGIC